ncbi:MAG: PqqD family protein [Croceibacterium sp.]
MTALETDCIPQKFPDRYVETAIDDEVVVMRLSDGDMYSLEGTARDIWNSVDGQRSIARIAADLAKRHDHDPAQVTADVQVFVAELGAAGLLGTDAREA